MNKLRYIAVVLFSLLLICMGPSLKAQGPAEQVRLHVNKSHYMPGEIIWFKAYFSNALGSPFSDDSPVLYVEILAPTLESVLQTKVAIGQEHSNGGSVFIPPHLSSGVYTLVAYTDEMKKAGAEGFFAQEIELLNPYMASHSSESARTGGRDRDLLMERMDDATDELGMAITSLQQSYSKRSQVELGITHDLRVDAGRADTDFSVSVYKLDDLHQATDLVTGRIGSIPDNRTKRDPLLTNPELRYHQISFLLTKKQNQEVWAEQDVFLAVPGPDPMLYTGRTDQNGIVTFYVKNLYGTQQLAVGLENGEQSDVQLRTPFQMNYQEYSVSGSASSSTGGDSEEWKKRLLDQSLNVQAENLFFAKERALTQEMPRNILPFFGERVVEYLLDDYTRFVLMEEVLREYVTEIRLQRRAGDYRFRVLNATTGQYFEGSPLILLDGAPIEHENDLIAFDPLKIKKISIVPSRYYLGNQVYEGVVQFSTYEGYLSDFVLSPNLTIFQYEGMQSERLFFSPQHVETDRRLMRMPDTRTALYWNPSVSVDASGAARLSFYTSDVPGDYVIEVRGRSSDGKMGSTTARFRVD